MGGKSITSKNDKVIAIVLQLCLIGVLAFGNSFFTLKTLSAFSIINTVVVIGLIFKIRKSILSISSMFMLFLGVFHFGQAWLYVFDAQVDTNISYDIFSLYPVENLFNILLFSLLSYNFISLFLLLFSKNNATTISLATDFQSEKLLYNRKIIFRFGIIFFFILLIPVIIYDYLTITITAQYGHLGLYDYSSTLSTWASANSYFPLAIIMVLLGCNPQKNAWKYMYYYAIGRCLLLMVLTGMRGSFVIPLLLYIFCKHHFIKKYKKKHFIIIAIACVLLLSMLSFISYGRGDYSDMDFIEFMKEKNLIVQVLSEFGASFTTTVLAYNYTISHGLLWGKSCLGALSVFVPFSGTLFPGIKEYMSVSGMLNPYSPSGGALGGSFFSEMYINFGFYSLILSPLFAWALSKIENIINNPNKYSLFAICNSIYTAYGFWIYVRGNFVDVVFASKRVLYVCIIFIMFKLFFVNRRVSSEKKSSDSIQ